MKEHVVDLLREGDWDGLVHAVRVRSVTWSQLIRALYLEDELVGWRAVEGFGRVIGELVTAETDTCREMLRRLLWAMNEESGSSGRRLPAALGEAVARAPGVFGDYALTLLGPLEEPFLQAAAAWGLGRIAQVRQDLVREAVAALRLLLDSPDSAVRGHGAWALGEMGVQDAAEELASLANDTGTVNIYLDGRLSRTTVGALARAARARLQAARPS